MKKLVFAFALALGGLAIGCTPSPEKVCSHVIDLVSKEMGDKKEVKDDEKKKAVDDCVKKAQEEKDKDADGWKCSAKCAMDASKLDDLSKCDDKCGTSKKKKGGDDEKKDKSDKG